MRRTALRREDGVRGGGEVRWIGALLCTLSASGFASLTILGKLALNRGISLTTVLGLRFTGAALLLALYFHFIRRQPLVPKAHLRWKLAALGSIGYAGQSTLYFSALGRNPASLNSLLLYIYPIFVALINWLLTRRPPTWREGTAMALASAGVALTLNVQPGQLTPGAYTLDPIGVALVMGSAAGYAVYIVSSERVVHQAGTWLSTMWISGGAGISFLVAGLVTQTLRPPSGWGEVNLILAMILFSTIMPLGTLLAGIRLVGSTAASLLSTLEPVFTVIIAVLFLNENLSAPQFVGGGLVLGAVILVSLSE